MLQATVRTATETQVTYYFRPPYGSVITPSVDGSLTITMGKDAEPEILEWLADALAAFHAARRDDAKAQQPKLSAVEPPKGQ